MEKTEKICKNCLYCNLEGKDGSTRYLWCLWNKKAIDENDTCEDFRKKFVASEQWGR